MSGPTSDTVTRPAINPLRPEHCQACRDVLAAGPPTLELIQACKECGFDVAQEEQDCRAAYEMAQRIAERFFPT